MCGCGKSHIVTDIAFTQKAINETESSSPTLRVHKFTVLFAVHINSKTNYTLLIFVSVFLRLSHMLASSGVK